MTDVQAGAALGLRTAFLGPRKCDACKVLAGRGLAPTWWGPDLPSFAGHLLGPGDADRSCATAVSAVLARTTEGAS